MFLVTAKYKLSFHTPELVGRVKIAAGRYHDRRTTDPEWVYLVWTVEDFHDAVNMRIRLRQVKDIEASVREE